ncbi:hypothetical protein BB560_000204 [Smittium megazygosporum]|uniref:Vacuolar protein sorting-associated protein 27 n=1 Tax=Smittium megazygosporum TaxID=133381 RepID=A0A2T9ZL52_9FUNG|nr:hypothetical protein BB560_000204 [Smittium megazygosporum]
MFSRLFFATPLETEIDEITSEEKLGNEIDFSLGLNYSDKVRSKEYSAKDVVKYLQQRFESENPNIQIKVIKFADLLVKNAGRLFIVEVSSRDFIDCIVSSLETSSNSTNDLKETVLKALYTWSTAFKGDRELSYVEETYKRYQFLGSIFDVESTAVVKNLTETIQAPDWVDSSTCMRCRTPFTLANRKHHCRACGKCFCGDCSNFSIPIPKFGIYTDVRVCQSCYLELKNVTRPLKPKSTPLIKDSSLPSLQPSSKPSPVTPQTEDQDLKRAIEISLQESAKPQNKATGYSDIYLAEREEMDLKQAIEASLKISNSSAYADNSGSEYPSQSIASNESPSNVSGYPNLESSYNLSNFSEDSSQSYDFGSRYEDVHEQESNTDNILTDSEIKDIELFKTLLAQIKTQGKNIKSSQQTLYLFESVSEIKPKIVQAIESIDEKHQKLLKLNERIMSAIRMYDELLEHKLSNVKKADSLGMVPNQPNSYNYGVPDVLSTKPEIGVKDIYGYQAYHDPNVPQTERVGYENNVVGQYSSSQNRVPNHLNPSFTEPPFPNTPAYNEHAEMRKVPYLQKTDLPPEKSYYNQNYDGRSVGNEYGLNKVPQNPKAHGGGYNPEPGYYNDVNSERFDQRDSYNQSANFGDKTRMQNQGYQPEDKMNQYYSGNAQPPPMINPLPGIKPIQPEPKYNNFEAGHPLGMNNIDPRPISSKGYSSQYQAPSEQKEEPEVVEEGDLIQL